MGGFAISRRLSQRGGGQPGVVPGPHQQVPCDLERNQVATGAQPHWPCGGDSTLGRMLAKRVEVTGTSDQHTVQGPGAASPLYTREGTRRHISWATEVWLE